MYSRFSVYGNITKTFLRLEKNISALIYENIKLISTHQKFGLCSDILATFFTQHSMFSIYPLFHKEVLLDPGELTLFCATFCLLHRIVPLIQRLDVYLFLFSLLSH